jgi:protein-L-isoaspartate(D-aspartate) O-methyltransferase
MARSLGDRANQQMVDRLVGLGTLWSPALIAAFRRTPRHRFLDRVYQYDKRSESWRAVDTRRRRPDQLRLVYADRALITHLSPAAPRLPPVPISSSSQPSLMAQMLEDLRLRPRQRVLEIGAGTGYNAALMAHVVAPGQVWSVDVDREVLIDAAAHLRAFARRPITLRHADGRAGLAEAAPFDRIVVTAATSDIEPAWIEQLTPDGLLLAPLAVAPGLSYVVCGGAADGVFSGRLMRAAYFMPLRTEGEPGEVVGESAPPRGPLQTLRAPWARWFERRFPRQAWRAFIQAFAFFGWLSGLALSFRTTEEGQPSFGTSDARKGHGCWFGPCTWQATGEAGRELATATWRAFLDIGGPRPTEFRLHAAPLTQLSAPDGGEGKVRRSGPLPSLDGRTTFRRCGPRCQQIWELIEPRDRIGEM